MNDFNTELLDFIACPQDKGRLHREGDALVCENQHVYPIVDGIPVLIAEASSPTIPTLSNSRSAYVNESPWFLNSVLVSEQQRDAIRESIHSSNSAIDPVASQLVAATNGIAYKNLVGNLKSYPIPDIRLPSVGELERKWLLDIGCSWGRWSIAAAKKGYSVIGMDPSLGAVAAARRVAKQCNVNANFVVGDARYLPFQKDVFDIAYSYSVIQHFSKQDARKTFVEIGRALKSDGTALIQMPTVFGLRCLYNQIRRGFRVPQNFEVRYWTIKELKETFNTLIGTANVESDCFFGIGWQRCDRNLMPWHLKYVLDLSNLMVATTKHIPPLMAFSDSVFMRSFKAENTTLSSVA